MCSPQLPEFAVLFIVNFVVEREQFSPSNFRTCEAEGVCRLFGEPFNSPVENKVESDMKTLLMLTKSTHKITASAPLLLARRFQLLLIKN